MSARIAVGDLVEVRVSGRTYFENAQVIYMPASAGECWIFRAEGGNLIYVPLPAYVELKGKAIKP